MKELREARGWSLRDCSVHVDVAFSFLAMIERGERTPSLQTVAKIASAFEVQPSALLGVLDEEAV